MAIALGQSVRVTRSEYDDLCRRAAAFGLEDAVPPAIRRCEDYERALAAARGASSVLETAASPTEPPIDDFEADGLYLDL